MRANSLLLVLAASTSFLAPAAIAQSQSTPEVALCDPFLLSGDNNNDNGTEDPVKETQKVRYDLEKAETLTTEQAIMDAVYEETWDLKTLAPVERTAMCVGQPTYVVNWAEILGKDENGEPAVIAKGFFRFAKDGTFEFDFNKRPYTGKWSVKDAQMTLDAPWLNKGEPVVSPVEHLITPIELTSAEGKVDTYDQESYRVGPFRLQPIETTAKGMVQDCACPTN
jgi:hypothetical protein